MQFSSYSRLLARVVAAPLLTLIFSRGAAAAPLDTCRVFSPNADFVMSINMPGTDATEQCAFFVNTSKTNPYFPAAGTWAWDTQPAAGDPVCTIHMDAYGDSMVILSQGAAPSQNGIAMCSIMGKYGSGSDVSIDWTPGITPVTP